jgi:hypothetical protein
MMKRVARVLQNSPFHHLIFSAQPAPHLELSSPTPFSIKLDLDRLLPPATLTVNAIFMALARV